jgi:chromosome segregation ATPase
MIRNQRRPYTQSPQSDAANMTVSNISGMNEDALKSLIVDSLKALSKNIDDLKYELKSLEEHFEYLDTRQRKIENDIEKSLAKSRATDADLISMRRDLEEIKKSDFQPAYTYGSKAETMTL